MKKASKKVQNSKKLKANPLAERLREAIHALGYRYIIDFISAIDVKKSTVYAILNGNTRDPGAKILERFYHIGINLNWLITGEEHMLRGDLQQPPEPGTSKPPKPYPKSPGTRNVEKKIRDALDDVLDTYQRLSKLREYAAELEDLDPQQQEVFHRLVRTFLDAAKRSE